MLLEFTPVFSEILSTIVATSGIANTPSILSKYCTASTSTAESLLPGGRCGCGGGGVGTGGELGGEKGGGEGGGGGDVFCATTYDVEKNAALANAPTARIVNPTDRGLDVRVKNADLRAFDNGFPVGTCFAFKEGTLNFESASASVVAIPLYNTSFFCRASERRGKEEVESWSIALDLPSCL